VLVAAVVVVEARLAMVVVLEIMQEMEQQEQPILAVEVAVAAAQQTKELLRAGTAAPV
jgi:hypothetical protein